MTRFILLMSSKVLFLGSFIALLHILPHIMILLIQSALCKVIGIIKVIPVDLFVHVLKMFFLSFTSQTPREWGTGFYPCTNCKYCKYAFHASYIFQGPNPFPILHRICCADEGIIYLIAMPVMFGEASRMLRTWVWYVREGVTSSFRTSETSFLLRYKP